MIPAKPSGKRGKRFVFLEVSDVKSQERFYYHDHSSNLSRQAPSPRPRARPTNC